MDVYQPLHVSLSEQVNTINSSEIEAILKQIELPSRKVLEKARIQLIIRERNTRERASTPSRQSNESYSGGDKDRLWAGGRGMYQMG